MEGQIDQNTIAERRKLARAMLAKAMSTAPIQSPWQGVANMANAAFAGWEEGKLDKAEREARAQATTDRGLLGLGSASASLPGAAAVADAVTGSAKPADPSAAIAATPAALAPVFTTKEAEFKLPANYLPQVANIESSFNPSAANPKSSARGLFQFTKGTARDYGLANPMDPIASTDAAARLAADNAKTLTSVLGRAPTGGELYLAHQQGGGGASALLANPNARAVDIVGRKAVLNNGGHEGMTAGEFARKWTQKVAQNEADLPASDAAVAEAPAAAPGFNIPGQPSMTGRTFDAITSGAPPLDPAFQAEGVSQPWMGSALKGASPAVAQVARAMAQTQPPSRPADLPAPGASEATGQMPQPAAQPIIADPTKDNAGVLSGLVASEEARKGLPSGAGVSSPLQALAALISGQSGGGAGGATPGQQQVASAMANQPVPAAATPATPSGSAAAPSQPVASPPVSDGVRSVASAVTAQPATNSSRLAAAERILNNPFAGVGDKAAAKLIVEQSFKDPNDLRLKKLQGDKLEQELKGEKLLTPEQEAQKIRLAQAGRTQVTVNGGGSDKQVFDTFAENTKEARAAATGLVALREARAALQGGAITGAGADTRLALQKIAAGFGGDPSKVINTETFRAAIAPQVAAVLKSTVGSANISDSDRRFAEKAAGGSIDLDEGSINRLLDIMEKASEGRLALHQQQLEAVYPDPEGNKRERALFTVKAPPKPERDPNAAVRVRTPDEARKLPKGTKIILPDGSEGVVP